jgi:hypothetical protein
MVLIYGAQTKLDDVTQAGKHGTAAEKRYNCRMALRQPLV